MRTLLGYLHEVWLRPDEYGNLLPACIPSGPDGDAARALNEPESDGSGRFGRIRMRRPCASTMNSSATEYMPCRTTSTINLIHPMYVNVSWRTCVESDARSAWKSDDSAENA